MWKLYASSGYAICITSTYETLTASLPTNFDDALNRGPFLGQVRYVQHDRHLLPTGNSFSPLMHKRSSLIHECECRAVLWRIVGMNDHPEGVPDTILDTFPAGIEVPVDLDALIHDVVVSPSAPPWFAEVVADLTGRYGFRFSAQPSTLVAAPYLRGEQTWSSTSVPPYLTGTPPFGATVCGAHTLRKLDVAGDTVLFTQEWNGNTPEVYGNGARFSFGTVRPQHLALRAWQSEPVRVILPAAGVVAITPHSAFRVGPWTSRWTDCSHHAERASSTTDASCCGLRASPRPASSLPVGTHRGLSFCGIQSMARPVIDRHVQTAEQTAPPNSGPRRRPGITLDRCTQINEEPD